MENLCGSFYFSFIQFKHVTIDLCWPEINTYSNYYKDVETISLFVDSMSINVTHLTCFCLSLDSLWNSTFIPNIVHKVNNLSAPLMFLKYILTRDWSCNVSFQKKAYVRWRMYNKNNDLSNTRGTWELLSNQDVQTTTISAWSSSISTVQNLFCLKF